MGWGGGRRETKGQRCVTIRPKLGGGCTSMALFGLGDLQVQGSGMQGGGSWELHVALPRPLPQGLLGVVVSEGLLLSRRTSMEGGVGLRNSFLRRE